jgi:hypothetical protein
MPKFQHRRPTREASPAPQHAKLAQAAPTRSASLRHLAPGAIVQRAMAAPRSLRPAELISMQRTLGNRAAGAMLGRAPVQAKLIVNAPGDRYEREADRVADAVMRASAMPREETPGAELSPMVMTKPAPEHGGDGSFAAGEDFAQRLQASRGRGRPLPPSLRETFGTKFGADFSAVRVHSDAEAAQLSHAIQAQAFTRGSDIFLGAGKSAADTTAGQRLLAHELTHVVQQGAAPVETVLAPQPVTQPGAAARPRGLFAAGSVSPREPAEAGVPALPQMAQPGAEEVIQRKITAGKLNVVGESHDESDPRRDDEKQMLEHEYDFDQETQYWSESEFYWNEKKVYADPRSDRVLQSAIFFLYHLKSNNQKKQQDELADFRQEVKNLQDPGEMIAARKLVNKIKMDQETPAAKTFGPQIYKDDFEQLLKENNISLDKTLDVLSEEVGFRRSVHMLEAARTSKQTGVWKVGDRHIEHMLGIADDKTMFTKRVDFNKDYDLFWANFWANFRAKPANAVKAVWGRFFAL